MGGIGSEVVGCENSVMSLAQVEALDYSVSGGEGGIDEGVWGWVEYDTS